MIFNTKVPKNKNTAKTAQAPGCTGFGSKWFRARLARYAPNKINKYPVLFIYHLAQSYIPRKPHAVARRPPIIPRNTA